MSRNYGLRRRDKVTQEHIYLLVWLALILSIGVISMVMWLR